MDSFIQIFLNAWIIQSHARQSICSSGSDEQHNAVIHVNAFFLLWNDLQGVGVGVGGGLFYQLFLIE